MTNLRKFFVLILFFICIFLTFPTKAQIIFNQLPGYRIDTSDSLFFNTNRFRKIIPLNGNWEVSKAGENNKLNVNIPSSFEGNGDLVFERKFSLTKDDLENHELKLVFLGVNYSAEISVNNKIIYTHTGGEFPFSFYLPRDILYSDRDNVLTVKVHYKLDSEDTIPLKQRFLFPKNFGGIFSDVYILSRPDISINDFSFKKEINESGKIKISISSRVINQQFNLPNDTLQTSNKFLVKTRLVSPDGNNLQGAPDYLFELKRNKEIEISQVLDISSVDYWTPSNPNLYTVRLELWQNGNLIDISRCPLAVYSFTSGKESFKLNNNDYSFDGVTYIPSNKEFGNLESYSDMENDIRMIKNMGFSAIRFAKSVPHPYLLYLCEKYGLLAFVEIPLNSVPENLARNQNFITRSKYYLSNFIKAYKKYSIAAIGLGGSYLTNSNTQSNYLSSISSFVKSNVTTLTYASFANSNLKSINGIDLYGIEMLNKSIKSEGNKLKDVQKSLGKGKIFISEATYVVNSGNTDGYVNKDSFEAQAKYFEDLLEYAKDNSLPGYFINTMFDYRGEYASIIAGYDENNIYNIGLCDENRDTDRLGYKVVYAKLHEAEKVTVPIGSTKDSSPMVYILFGLLLAVVMGVLVNSGRKFREDASRALLRPYNFFADVRDQRIMSGAHSIILYAVIAAVIALISGNFLSYLRNEVILEKIFLSLGSHSIMNFFSYFAWHPIASLFWLTIIFAAMLMILSIIIKAASFFIRNRVYFSSVFFTVVWSFLPIVLLIPVGIVLYRILNSEIANTLIYYSIIIYALWIFYRLIKGIYVIFDVNPGSVYFYSILILLLVIGGILLYGQINNSVLSYLQLTLKQFNILV
ncbi:MAG TPA: glycoside hydrolase family 2 TIM barrel-domain containing protein [Ignavibacteriaceae bacterium]|nr:glycoside hydrolase family 2 TIM barrel-domain containing protein [Ignavibacteriaceae bacterium]